MRTTEKVQKWVQANAKCLTLTEFKEETGVDFWEFGEQYKKACIDAWREFHGVAPSNYLKYIPKCNCNKQEKMEANAVQAKNTANPIPIRIWECPIHKHTFCHLKDHSEKSLKILNQ